jgi:hypothetical protein
LAAESGLLVSPQIDLTLERPKSEAAQVLRVSVAALVGFAFLYCLFFFIDRRFPYVKPGSDLISEYKRRMARSGNPFRTPKGSPTGNPTNGRLHVMIFGFSTTLAGFVPAQFDSEMAAAGFPAVESYNFGLPGDSGFVDSLEAMAARGTAPDVALLTFPWPAKPKPEPTFFHFMINDSAVMDLLFPFRKLPRNAVVMAIESHGLRGMGQRYRRSRELVEQSIADRGYYFIVRESRYENDRLPDDFSEPTDKPRAAEPRVVTLGPIYEQLAPVLAAHKIQCIFIPNYFRQGKFAPVPARNEETAKLIASQPNLATEGPDYWRYPNREFADTMHANRVGARHYTHDLAGLVADWLRQHKTTTQ